MKNTIEPDDVEWEMDWGANPPQGRPQKEPIFEQAMALAHLIMNEVVYINSHWWKHYDLEQDPETKKIKSVPSQNPEWSAKDSELISVHVECNDVFAWGSADAEDLPYKEIKKLYQMWKKDPTWGSAIWCMQRRNQMPQGPVEKRIREAGIWDLDSMGLEPNAYDKEWKDQLAKRNEAK